MRSILWAAAALVACLASPALARTWEITVDGLGDAPTIQAGIDSSAAGDTVLVGPGTYYGSIDFKGKAVTLRSASGSETTILEGTGAAPVVGFISGETRAAVLQGFTLTHGILGVTVFNASPSILENKITENGPAPNGGGIWCDADTFTPWYPLIQGNTITNNRANNLGGGVGTHQGMVPDILDNYIADNEAISGDGGGIYYRTFHDGAVIRGNTVINNRAGDHGGGIYAGNVNSVGALKVEISWNLVANNYAKGSLVTGNSGGGIWLWQTQAWVHHNTVVGNTGDGPNNAYGGGILAEQPGSPLIEKNIIAYSQKGGGIWCGNGATPTIRNNLAWQNAGGDGVGDCATWWQADGNIVADPAFCDTLSGDFHLHQDSPAITHVDGPLGVYPIPGCGPVPVRPITWGRLKTRYQ